MCEEAHDSDGAKMQGCDEAYVLDGIADLRGNDSVGAKFGDMKRCKVCEIKMHIIIC